MHHFVVEVKQINMSELKEKEILIDEEEKKSVFNLANIWALFCLNWYWVLLSVVVCMIVAWGYLKFTSPVYSSSMKILVKDSEQKSRGYSSIALDEMGFMSNSNGFDNELEIIRSVAVSKRVVKRLKLYVTYFAEGKLKNTELYKESPIFVDMIDEDLNNLHSPLKMDISVGKEDVQLNTYFDIRNPENKTSTFIVKHFPDTVVTEHGRIILTRNPEIAWNDSTPVAFPKIMATIYPVRNISRSYAGRLSARPTSKTTTVANIGFVDTKTRRALDYLRELVTCYNEDANEDKNEVARKTEEFISERLQNIRAELDETEGGMESYKRENELINLSNDATTALSNYTAYQKEKVQIQTQMSLVKALINYMDDSNNYLQIIPANLGLNNASLVSMISEYNELALKRNRYLKGSSEENPLVQQLTRQLSDLWPSIKDNMKSVYMNMELQSNSIEEQFKHFSSRIAQTPTQERVLTNIDRQRQLKSDLYLTLLQKREENYIQLYSTASKARVIDEPIVTGKISPKNQMIFTGAFVFGLGLPMVLLLGMSLLRYRIEGREDVEQLTKLPILADIPMSREAKDSQHSIVVKRNRNDMMEEAFRGLRTNLNFILRSSEKVILVTSCVPSEGKSFVAANLAMSMALLNKKVLVVGLDIRKPRLVNLFGLKSDSRGIVSFLNSTKPDYELLLQQISQTDVNPNMYVLPAGIIPPNPAELLASPLLAQGIEYLSNIYDYIILDTPPVGLVADTLSFGHIANTTLFVVRADFSPKSNFALINDISAKGKLPKCNIVLNSIDLKKRKYGYYYGAGKYAKYGAYGRYGHYGVYGKYGQSDGGSYHTEK